jgi:hypothetical protein
MAHCQIDAEIEDFSVLIYLVNAGSLPYSRPPAQNRLDFHQAPAYSNTISFLLRGNSDLSSRPRFIANHGYLLNRRRIRGAQSDFLTDTICPRFGAMAASLHNKDR